MVAVAINWYSVSESFSTDVSHLTGSKICALPVKGNNKILNIKRAFLILMIQFT
jgi:hypothetical protein